MRVVFLAKPRHAGETMLRRFAELGAVRGHDVQWRDKADLTAADLTQAQVVCLKSRVDDRQVWHMIEAHGVRAVNARAASGLCGDRLMLDAVLRAGGVRTPRCARNAAEVARLRYPVVCKANPMSAPREMRILQQPPEPIDCERWFHQELIEGDGVVHKAYAIGAQTFVVDEAPRQAAQGEAAPPRSAEQPMPAAMAEATREVGRLTGLEVYGVDFVGRGGDLQVIDVNPFPGFRGLPRAADALWDYLERIA